MKTEDIKGLLGSRDFLRAIRCMRNIHFTGTIGVFDRQKSNRERVFTFLLDMGLCEFRRVLVLTDLGESVLMEVDHISTNNQTTHTHTHNEHTNCTIQRVGSPGPHDPSQSGF